MAVDRSNTKPRPVKTDHLIPHKWPLLLSIFCVVILLYYNKFKPSDEDYRQYCYNPMRYPQLASIPADLSSPIVAAFATRVLPSRLDSQNLPNLVSSLLEFDMLNTNSTLSIYVDHDEFQCTEATDFSPNPEFHQKITIKANDEACIERYFSSTFLELIPILPSERVISIIELEPSQRKNDILDIAKPILQSNHFANGGRINESLMNIDFHRAMSSELKSNRGATFYLWIEDDVVMTRSLVDLYTAAQVRGYNYISGYSPYHGITYDYGTCLVGFTKTGLEQFLDEVLNTLGYRPLDMAFKQYHQHEIMQCVPSCAVHNDSALSTIRSESSNQYYSEFPGRQGYPFGHSTFSSLRSIIKWSRYKLWEVSNFLGHHIFTTSDTRMDWDRVKSINMQICNERIHL